MPMYVQNNTSLNYKIDFIVDDQAVTPTSASITLTKNDGSVVGGISNVSLTIPAEATSVVYTVAAGNNVPTLDYELRYIDIDFVYDSKTYHISDYYTLRASLRLPVTKDEVRALGLPQLDDDQIDLFVAYNQVQDLVEADLDALISSGSILIPSIQQAVRIQAALNSMTFIESNLFQSEQADNTTYKRFASVDFQSIFDRLNDLLANALRAIDGITSADTAVIFIVATGTDPVTGSA